MGKPGRGNARSPYAEFIGVRSERGEVKHLSTRRKRNQFEIPSVAASERGRAQTVGSDTHGVVGLLRGHPGESSSRRVAEGAWKGPPERVIVP
jgi:hypothetical protein